MENARRYKQLFEDAVFEMLPDYKEREVQCKTGVQKFSSGHIVSIIGEEVVEPKLKTTNIVMYIYMLYFHK